MNWETYKFPDCQSSRTSKNHKKSCSKRNQQRGLKGELPAAEKELNPPVLPFRTVLKKTGGE